MTGIKNDLILRAARGERTERTPVWLMRQAGRFDPEYRALRERSNLTLEATFSNPDLATEITLLPKRLGVDALILFQDILTPLTPMGAPFIFRPGPILEHPIRSAADVDRLRVSDPTAELGFIVESIRNVNTAVAGELPLLGFAGAPMTLAAFMIEGGSPGGQLNHTRTLMQENPALVHALLERLADMTAAYLRMKIDAGVHGVQLFESIADLLTADEYRAFAHPYQRRVFEAVDRDVPRILFAKEQPDLELMAATGAGVVSIGKCSKLAEACESLRGRCAIQGNVDNMLLMHGSAESVEQATRDCIRAGGHTGHILNLNHGLLKDTPFDNVCRLIDVARSMVLSPDELPAERRRDEQHAAT